MAAYSDFAHPDAAGHSNPETKLTRQCAGGRRRRHGAVPDGARSALVSARQCTAVNVNGEVGVKRWSGAATLNDPCRRVEPGPVDSVIISAVSYLQVSFYDHIQTVCFFCGAGRCVPHQRPCSGAKAVAVCGIHQPLVAIILARRTSANTNLCRTPKARADRRTGCRQSPARPG